MKKLITLLAFLLLLYSAHSQVTNKGKLFWVAFPEVARFNKSNVDSFVLYMSSDVATSVDVELFGLGSVQTVKVKPGQIASLNMTSWNSTTFLDNRSNGAKQVRRAVKVTSADPITLYAMAISDYKSDGTFVMPYEAIPTNPTFIIGSYFANVGNSGARSPSEFTIVGMDRVDLRIKPSTDTKDGKVAGVPFYVTLNRGQVIQIQTKDDAAHTGSNIPTGNVGDLTGTIITVVGSNCGKYNVFSGAREVTIPFRGCGGASSSDHLLSQNFPTSVLGTEYVTAPFSTHTRGYVFRAIASQPNTKVWVDGTLVATLSDTGKFYTQDVTTAVAKYIVSDKPIYFIQYMKTDACAGTNVKGDPAIIATPTVKQMITRATVAAPKTGRINTFFLNIITKSSAKNAVTLDGVSVPAGSFIDIGTSGYCYTQRSIQSKSYNIRCDSGMIAITYGIGDFESYAYCAGATFENLNYDILIQKTGRCPNQNINFEAKILGKYKAIEWDFGDGGKDTGRYVGHAYKEAGAYTINMKVKQELGCGQVDSTIRSKTIIVDGARPNFPDTTIVCGNTINLTLDATYTVNYEYKWHNGSTSQFFPVKATGKYKVTVNDTLSKCAVSDSTIVVQYDTFIARIGYDTLKPCINLNKFVLSDFSKYSNDAFKSASWRVVNEKRDTINYKTSKISLNFIKTGEYPVFYEATTKKGCKSRDTVLLNVYDLPKAAFTVDDTIKCAKTNFVFTDQSTDVGGIATSIWDFGNGKKDTGLTVRYAYLIPDTFKVTMQAISFYGCRDTADTMVVVKSIPKAIINHSAMDYCLGTHNLVFSDSTKDISGGWTNKWFKNGIYSSTGSNTGNVKFADSGNQTIKLVVTNNYQCKDSINWQVKIYKEPKAIIGITDSSNCLAKNFFDIVSYSTTAKGESFVYKWTLSDGSSSTAANFKKTFATVGVKNIKLLVTTNRGCKDSVTRKVKVDSMPNGRFTVGNLQQCLPSNDFDYKTIVNYASPSVKYLWRTGNGNTFTNANPKFTYADTGKYIVTLLLTDGPGCKDSQTVSVRVLSKPSANWTTNTDSMCLGSGSFNFTQTNPSAGQANSWNYGDSRISTIQNPTGISYSAPGNYTVNLTTVIGGLCSTSVAKIVKVFGVPQASFLVNDSTQCEDVNSFVFTNTSFLNSATGVQYTWTLNPGGNSYSVRDIAPINLPTVGKYNLNLNVISDKGCETDFMNSLELYPSPTVTITGQNQCKGIPVVFTENVVLSSGTITNYNWNFGDARTGNTIPATHTYTNDGSYNASLQVTSDKGCVATSNTVINIIYPLPTASFTGTYLLSRGAESDYQFVSTSTGVSTLRWTYSKLIDIDNSATVNKTFFDTGNLKVQLWVSNANGCVDSTSKKYLLKPQLLFHMPNAFSPNDKGGNNTFRGSSDYGMESYIMTIFNRWGGVIYRTNNPSQGWDGNGTDGKPVMEGAYAYLITFKYFDGTFHQYKGSVQVIR
jgi:gliding motility-associated-like protein